MVVAAITFVIGSIFLRETRGHKIWEEVGDTGYDGHPRDAA
jgi:hypothetical protein